MPRGEDFSLLAMTHHRLGNREEAQRYLELARKEPERASRRSPDEATLLAEAEALLAEPAR